ncbi:MAG: SoxR reducing system RseC family protein [Candidatus Omnitrophica bacterium]|nr:SoxR reducing system RseC family protein [Candidatus Omnitrophota bacterium]
MKENGRVVDIKGATAVVELGKKPGGCGSCCICRKNAGGKLFLEAENGEGIEIGDSVTVEIDDTAVLKGVLFIYMAPLAGFILGIAASSFIKNIPLKITVFLTVLGLFWYYGLKKGNEEGKKNRARITSKKTS